AAYSRLPGYDETRSLVRALATGIDPVTIEESASDGQANWRFAPVLQCLQAMRIGSEGSADQIRDLVVDRTNHIDVRWSLQGESPHRALVVTADRTGLGTSAPGADDGRPASSGGG